MDQTNTPSGIQLLPVGFWSRLAAVLVDSVLVNVYFFIMMKSLSMPVLLENGLWVILGGMVLAWAYSITTTTLWGGTIGKLLIGARVRTDLGETASVGRVALREIVGKFVSALILGIGFLMVAFTEKKQGLHDIIAHTKVVFKDEATKRSRQFVAPLIIILWVIAVIALLVSGAMAGFSKVKGVADETGLTQGITDVMKQVQTSEVPVVR